MIDCRRDIDIFALFVFNLEDVFHTVPGSVPRLRALLEARSNTVYLSNALAYYENICQTNQRHAHLQLQVREVF